MTSIGAGSQLARLLGALARAAGPPPQPRLRRARRRGPRPAHRRPAAAGRAAAGRAGAGRGAQISRTTVTAAYRELRETGHLTSRRGAGSWTTLPGGHRVASSGLWTPRRRPRHDRPRLRGASPRRRELCRRARAAAEDLPPLPGRRRLPPDRHRRAARGGRRRLHRRAACPPRPTRSWSPAARSTRSTWCCGCPCRPARSVLVESPTYPNALAALSARRARIATHGLDATTGWDAELLLGALRQTRPRLAYLIPEFQNPTGHLMPADAARAAASPRRTRPAPTWSSTSPSWTCALDGDADAAAGRRLRPALAGGLDRRDEQAVLGRAAHRLGARLGAAGAAAGRAAGRRRHGQPGARPARRRTPAGARRRDRAGAGARSSPPSATRWSPRCARSCRSGASRVPSRRRDAVGRAGRPGLQRAGPRGRGGRRAAGARPALRRWTARWSASCGCRSRCPPADLVEAVQRIAAVRYDLDRASASTVDARRR